MATADVKRALYYYPRCYCGCCCLSDASWTPVRYLFVVTSTPRPQGERKRSLYLSAEAAQSPHPRQAPHEGRAPEAIFIALHLAVTLPVDRGQCSASETPPTPACG